MTNKDVVYEIRTIAESAYNSHADLLVLSFTNGLKSYIGPAGHSDERKFTPGTNVVCRLKRAEKEDGFHLEGLAKIIEFSEDGYPVKFGDSISNKADGRNWVVPTESDGILDKRIK